MEAQQRYQNISDNVLLKNGIVTLTGTKDDIGCHLITFQSQQQLLFTQIDYSSLTESLYVIIMYYKSLPVSLLVNMSNSNQMFIDHFIHVVDQLERKMSRSEIQRVYIVRPERKSIQKHLSLELGSTSKDNARITAQVVIVKTFEELYQHVKRKYLTIDFGGTLEHDYRAWLAVQKMLTEYYNLVNDVAKSSGDILQRLRDLITSEKLGSRTSGKDTEHAQKKRLQNLEKKKNTLLSQCSFAKAVEDSQRLRSYFQDPKLYSGFQAVSKSPVFEMDKARFQPYYRKVLTLRDSIEHVWTDGVGNMKSLATEQELYDRLIECCTWIVEEGLPYLTSLPGQSKTLAEAMKQKITFENELFKPMKVTLKKSRQTLKGVRHYQRSLDTNSGSLDLMADNLTSLMENIKTKANERMEYLKKLKDFMQSLAKAESWCERATDLWPANQMPSTTQEKNDRSPLTLSRSKVEHFLNKHPPLTGRELGHLLDYVDNIDDFELRTRARLLGGRCQELEKILRASERQRTDVIGEELSSDHESSYSPYSEDLSYKQQVYREENQSPLRSTISSDVSNKRWNDDLMSSTTISNDDATLSGSRTARLSTGSDSRLAGIQRRLRDQELLYEQLILEEELRELSKSKSSPKRGEVNLTFDETFESQKNTDISRSSDRSFEKGNRGQQNGNGKLSEADFRSSFGESFDSRNMSRVVDSGTSRRNFESVGKAGHSKKAKLMKEGLRSANLSSFSRRGNVKNVDEIVSPGTSTKAFVKRNDKKQQNHVDLRNEELGSTVFTSSLKKSGDVKNMKNMVESSHSDGFGSLDSCNTSCFDDGVLKPKETKQRDTTNLPSHIDLLDGCNSLKRLCNLGNTLPQNNISDFETYYNQANISAQIPVDPLFASANASTLSNGLPFVPRSSDFKSYRRDPESSHDVSSERFVKGSPEMTYDSKSRAHDHGKSSCDLKTNSHDFESCSRDFKDQSRDNKSKSREELLKEARGEVNHWTQVKNEQRARLTHVIDDISKRKEIEETYFNAQIQLCRARRNFTNLGKSDSTLNTSLSLHSDVPNGSIAPPINTSLRLGTGGDQVADGDGAFRKYVKEETRVAQNSDSDEVCPLKGEKGTMLDDDDPVGIPGVNDGVKEGKVVLDNESLLGVTSDVIQDVSESLGCSDFTKTQSEKTAIPSDDRVILEGNGNELDSEQGSSDEFDDAEEEELMLLCSQSSSDLLSQDELKNSLRGEQARLEEKFRQQNEQLRIEREKLMEEERRINEWQINDGVPIAGENINVEGSQGVQLVDNADGILNKGDHAGEISQPHVMKQLQHEVQQLQHGIQRLSDDTNKSQQELPPLPTNLPIFKLDMTKTEHENPAPQHETRFPQHEIPLPENEPRIVENDLSKQQKEKLSQDEEDNQDKLSDPKPLGIESSTQEMMSFHEKFSYFEALNQKQGGPKQITFGHKNVETINNSPKENVNDSVNAERDLNDLSEIVLSNVDSDDESRKKIEEELIEILQDRTLQIDGEKSQEQDQESVPNLPPLGLSGNPPSMLDNSDDIDLMNQHIDDLMISDRNNPDHSDYDEFSSDITQQTTGGNHEVNVDAIKSRKNGSLNGRNGGVEVNNDGIRHDGETNDCDIKIDVKNESGMSKGSIGLNVDNGEINLGDLGINVGIDLGGVNSDGKPEMSLDIIRDQDQGGHMKMENRRYNDSLGESSRSKEMELDADFAIDLNKDSGAIKSNDLIPLLSNHEATSGDDNTLSEDESPRNKELEIDVDFTINLDNDNKEAQSNLLIGLLSNREATSGDEITLSEDESQQNDGLELDVDFTSDLNEHSEEVQGNDLIDLLRNQSGAFSSQESLVDDDYLTEGNYEIPNNSQPYCGPERLERETTFENNQVHEDTDDGKDSTNGALQPEKIVDINGERLGITGHTHDHNGITGRPSQGGISESQHIMSEESDDDFGRVLEDIQEEESEYEDLMGYRPAQVDNNENLAQKRAEIIAPITSAVRLSGQVKTEGNMQSGSFTSSIIIDPGTGYCKAGFSIDDQPRVSIPSIVGTPKSQLVNSGRYKENYVGEEAKHLHPALDLHRPLKNGLVQDWDLMEKLLDEVYEELRCESDQYPVLISEPVLNPKSNREEMIQMMFETFHVPAAYSCAQAVLSLFATGRTTGLVYDCGYSKAHSVPVYEGYALPRGTTTVTLAGHELTMCLSRMLRDRGVTMETQTELDIVQDIKEKLCYVVVDYDSERKAYNTGQRNDTVYAMPDGQTVAIGSERFRCPEVLFTPSMVGMTTDGVHEVLYKTALQCAIDVRKSLFQNIVISGGSTMFSGFPRRLHVELCKLFGTMTPDINIDAVEDRNVLTWQGGAMLSKLSNFQSMWISSAEYNECGPGIVHKKCV